MYCRNCGKELAENAKFCKNCGAQINAAQPAGSFAEEGQSESRQAAEMQNSKQGREPRRGDRWWKILLVIIVCAAAVAVFFFLRPVIQEQQLNNHMEDGKTFLEDEDYDKAVAAFSAAIAIDPKAVPAYQQLAEAYINLDETESAENTYQDAIDEILDSYEESGLLDGAEDLYEAAIIYYGVKGDSPKVTDLVDEITGMLTDEEEAAEIKQLGQTYTDNEDTGETDQSDEEERPSEEQVADLLETFKNWANEELLWCYTTNMGGDPEILADYETIDAADAYIVAALALRENREITAGQTVFYRDGTFYDLDEYNAMSSEQKMQTNDYMPISTSYYEECLRNLFGEEYSLDDFREYAGQVNGTVLEDADGQFYVEWGDYINEGVDIAIVDFSDTPDEDGLYTVLVEYTVHWAGGEPDDINYMQYRIAPDESSDYGCRIVGMVPAGNGEIEDAFKPQAEVKDNDSDDEVYMEWQQLYADYIEQAYLEIDTEAESVNQVASEEAKEYYYYYLIYLNNDDVPELLRCSSPNYNRGMTFDCLLYIQDSEVKEKEIINTIFAERGGYIASQAGYMAVTTTVWRLNEQNELVTELEAYEDYTDISVNGQDVSREEYDSKVQEGLAWRTSGEYTVLSAGNGILKVLVSSEPYDTYEDYAFPFATWASNAIAALRGGYIDPV